MLKDNFDKVNANIQAACDRAGRNREGCHADCSQ